MKTISIATFAVAAVASFGQAMTFKVGAGSPAQQLAQVESVTEFETFTGRTEKVTGTISFDPARKTGSGRIVVDAASVDTGIPLRNEHMRSEQWLNTAKNPQIIFQTTSVKPTGKDTYTVQGNLTMNGVTRPVTSQATVRYRKASDATRNAGFKGDVLQVRASFKVKLADYGIKIAGPAQGKVAPTVTISVSLYGQSGA